MKTKLFKMWLEFVKYVFSHKSEDDKTQNIIEFDMSNNTDVKKLHEFARRYWTFEDVYLKMNPRLKPSPHVIKMIAYAREIKRRYKSRSRKWKLSSSKLSRVIEHGQA